jgi:hypothetical protein
MIKLYENKDEHGENFTLEADEPVTLTGVGSHNSGHLVMFVYKGTADELDEHTEPVIVYDSDADPKVLDLQEEEK